MAPPPKLSGLSDLHRTLSLHGQRSLSSLAAEDDESMSPFSRSQSGMLVNGSGRPPALTRQRSMSAPMTPLFTPLDPGATWADVMDKEDVKMASRAWDGYDDYDDYDDVYHLQSGLPFHPQYPPGYTENAALHSDFSVPEDRTGAEPCVRVGRDPYVMRIEDDGQTAAIGHISVDIQDDWAWGQAQYLVTGKTPRLANHRAVDGLNTPQGYMNEAEQELCNHAIHYLSDGNINPYRGSVAVEKIQNVLRSNHRDLYQKVVGTGHRSWNAFINKWAVFFETFCIDDGKWRMRLRTDTTFQKGDDAEKQAREDIDFHLLTTLINFLRTCESNQCKVDDFMAAYPYLPENRRQRNADGTPRFALRHRGDFVRFVKKHPKIFQYVQAGYYIVLIQQSTEPHQPLNAYDDRGRVGPKSWGDMHVTSVSVRR
uniref:Uncharacterized protein n=1 Tax=Eutreptiella gymnastica TaxID=73025 RepID=A0A7S1HY81_9EUGL|mmetsp:Transcript_114197/g.198508  ORF Transcript_114197/g.198508 Transcript_114197/m.198508 type:complete len:426 (+) Transcript_114197:35-1312(+)